MTDKNNVASVSVINVLDDIGPSLSSKVVETLVSRYGLSKAAAQKRIERARTGEEILALEAIRFPHNEQLLFLSKHKKSKEFTSQLIKVLGKSGSAYRYPIIGLMAKGGATTAEDFPVVSGYPASKPPRSRDLYSDSVLYNLLQAGLLERDRGNIRINKELFNSVSNARIHARALTERLCLEALKDILSLQGLTSWDKANIRNRDNPPQFGYYRWDFVAPTYLRPIASKGLPGFFVADITLGRSLTSAEVTYFIHKCNQVRGIKTHRPFVGMLISTWFEKDALLAGRSAGLIFTTPNNLFGAHFSSALDSIVQALEQKQSFIESKPNFLEECMKSIGSYSHLAAAFDSVKEMLFRLTVGYTIYRNPSSTLQFDCQINDEITVDILVTGQKEIIAIWCKVESEISQERLNEWFKTQVEPASEIFVETEQKTKFIYCTSAESTMKDKLFLDELNGFQQAVEIQDVQDISMKLMFEHPSLWQYFSRLFDVLQD